MSAWDDGMNVADQLRESVYEIRALKARVAAVMALADKGDRRARLYGERWVTTDEVRAAATGEQL